jgi:aminomethyltransferase
MSIPALKVSVSAIQRFTTTTTTTGSIKRGFAAAASSETLVKTACYDLHKELGGDMVPFAGYELPVLYKGENGGVMKEHLWCREEGKAAMFDVSHMGQVRLRQYSETEYHAACMHPAEDRSIGL